MRALVISGGGSKGAFAGGIAQYLLEEEKQSYDLFLGTSTGSLLISHLALGKVETIKEAFTQVNQSSIFSNNPFLVVHKNGVERIKINHFNVLKNFIRVFRGMDFDKKLDYFILTLKNLQLDWTRLLLRVSYWHRPR